jgi:hypothetical protein
MAIRLLAGNKHESETTKAILACNDYLRMGVGRSLEKLRRIYAKDSPTKPPTKHLKTLKDWSAKYGWVERSKVYDQRIDDDKEEVRKRVFNEGLALDFERVLRLIKLAELLEGQVFEEINGTMPNLWVQDVKGIGSKDDFERVEIERYNSAIVSDLRGVIDDIAKEVGGRRKGVDVTSDGKELKQLTAEDMSTDDLRKAIDDYLNAR